MLSVTEKRSNGGSKSPDQKAIQEGMEKLVKALINPPKKKD